MGEDTKKNLIRKKERRAEILISKAEEKDRLTAKIMKTAEHK